MTEYGVGGILFALLTMAGIAVYLAGALSGVLVGVFVRKDVGKAVLANFLPAFPALVLAAVSGSPLLALATLVTISVGLWYLIYKVVYGATAARALIGALSVPVMAFPMMAVTFPIAMFSVGMLLWVLDRFGLY